MYTRSDLEWPHWYLAQALATDRAGYLYYGTTQVGIQTSQMLYTSYISDNYL